MYIKYNEYELFELFESEPITPSGKEAGQFIYSKKEDSRGIEIMLSFSVYEMKCNICLSAGAQVIFEATLEQVEYLHSDGKCLRIHQMKPNQDYLIHFMPSIFIKIGE